MAVLNGLVLIDFILDLWHKQGDLIKAIVEATLIRLRPTLMTALVTKPRFCTNGPDYKHCCGSTATTGDIGI